MFFYRLKNGISALLATLFACVFCFCITSGNVCKLSKIEGKRTFYLDSASSQSLRKSVLEFTDFFRVKGESVRFDLHEISRNVQMLAREIAESYHAEILFVEETGGTLSFYCYTPWLYQGVCVQGKTVNLHIAVSQTQCAVGSPIIFDGF